LPANPEENRLLCGLSRFLTGAATAPAKRDVFTIDFPALGATAGFAFASDVDSLILFCGIRTSKNVLRGLLYQIQNRPYEIARIFCPHPRQHTSSPDGIRIVPFTSLHVTHYSIAKSATSAAQP